MMNQAAVEALYSATFAEDYLDVVENMPNEMQRHLSRLREADLAQYREFWCDLDKLVDSFESETTLSGQRQILDKIKKGLILTQDMGDEKLAVMTDISDLIESKTRLLEHDAKNLDFGKDEDEEDEEPERPPERATEKASSAKKQAGVKQSGVSSKNRASGAGHGHGDRDKDDGKAEKQSASVAAKRRKKQNEGRGGGGRGNDDRDDDEQSTASSRSNAKSRSAGGGAGGGGNGSAKKTGIASKRKSTAKANSSRRGDDKDDSDRDEIDPSNFDIDPDEPTYCLCDQVSYGDMIGCDNDLCPIEWFHFNCVQLTSKPKGKWYCPKCRGDKVTVMKPKAQFLKELEKYNKEREMKMDRHNS